MDGKTVLQKQQIHAAVISTFQTHILQVLLFATMMKSIIFASLIAGAAAFAPVAQKSASTALNMAFEDELGAQPPLGFFDRTLVCVEGYSESYCFV